MTTLRTLCISLSLVLIPALAVEAQRAPAPSEPVRDMTIQLRSMTFDPVERPPQMAESLRFEPSERSDWWIVQFQRPLSREERAALGEDFGLNLNDFVPNLAYVERLDSDTLERLRQHPLVRATVAYQPAFKLSPTIGRVEFRSQERLEAPGLLLRAVLFPGVDPGPTAEALRAMDGVTEVEVIELPDMGELAGEMALSSRVHFRVPSRDRLSAVARLHDVRWIETVAERDEDNGNTAGTMQSGTPGDEPVWDRGIHGEGQIIGVIDSGPVDIDHCMFEDPVDNTPQPTHRKVLEVRGGGVSGHATFVAGIALGDDFNNAGTGANRGNAWAARLVSGRNSEPMLNALAENRNDGAVIHTNSWHDNTDGAGRPALYNQTAREADLFTWFFEDHLVFGSMGNNGEEQGPPGTAKNAVGINASRRDPNENTVGDGNPGPTADGRRKPDVVTPGCRIRSAAVNTACTINLSNVCATSWATPAAAAAATLIRQYYAEGWYPTGTAQPANARNPTGSLVKATLLNGTLDMTGHAGYPGNTEGWGLVRLDDVLFFPGDIRSLRAWDRRHAAGGLATGEFEAFAIDVATSAEPLKVTLVWADPPGAAGAAVPMVNDLDLTVIAPDGTTFRGNVFAGGVSVPGGAPDQLNNVERVVVPAPAIGTWTLRVAAPAVNVGLPGQGFAVVATAAMAAPDIQVPGDLLLARTCVGDTGAGTVEVCNTGKGDLVVESIASSNPRFAVPAPSSGFPVTISPDFCFPFTVTFDPLAAADQAAILTVANNDPETPSVMVDVAAVGSEQDVQVGGSTEYGVTSAWGSAERDVEVCNVGHCDLAVTGAMTDCPDFTLTGNPAPVTLSSSSCATLTVAFTPVLPGLKSCQLTVDSDDPDSPAVVRPLRARTPPQLSIHGGWADAHGALGMVAKDGSAFHLDFVYPVSTQLAYDLRLGIARLDGQPGFGDTDVWSLGANAKFTFNPAAPVRVFVNGGPKAYHFDPGDLEAGLNVGLGLGFPAGSRFAIELTYNYEWALTANPDLEFSELEAGLLVSF